jgi:diketogulonate reductase-like aldo/keto reductase
MDHNVHDSVGLSRRNAMKLFGAIAASLTIPSLNAVGETGTMLKRPIPRSGELLPAVGLGTWQTFDVGPDAGERAQLSEVLRLFVEMGGSVVDSSPMYGNAETVVGDLATELGVQKSLFIATKVWTSGHEAGIRQMQTSMQRLRADPIDLMQVHNLLDLQTQLKTLRKWKQAGKIRYLGVTHYREDAFDALERLIKSEKLDFVQLNYNIIARDAERRVLPAAADNATAVLINRPFEGSSLFGKVKGKSLPPWAAEFDCESWSQFFLKYILSHPAVTCPIPATRNPKHLADNMRAGYGRLPDGKMRVKMVEYVERL